VACTPLTRHPLGCLNAQYKANGGARITALNTTWLVPANPAVNFGSNAPGWWFGIQTADGAGALIQPILAWGYEGNEYDIFNGVYDWNVGAKSWSTSESCTVQPGDKITSSVTLAPGTSTYTMAISTEACGEITMDKVVDNNSGLNESVAYFVLEHQPLTCKAYPADGAMKFEDIYVEVEYEAVPAPQFESQIGVNACNSACVVEDPRTITFTWDTDSSAHAQGLDAGLRERVAPLKCAKDVEAAAGDLKNVAAGIDSAVATCAADDLAQCLVDIDSISESVAQGAVDVDSAIVDCGKGEDSVCADTVVDVVGDFASLTEAVAAAAIHCESEDMSTIAGKKQCIQDVEASATALKSVVYGVEKAASDCA